MNKKTTKIPPELAIPSEIENINRSATIPPELMAQYMARQEAERRAATCFNELKEILTKHNCTIDIQLTITMQGNSFRWQVVALPNQK